MRTYFKIEPKEYTIKFCTKWHNFQENSPSNSIQMRHVKKYVRHSQILINCRYLYISIGNLNA